MADRRTTPFLKWAGGKRQLLAILTKLISQKSVTYYEPFLGGGSVFFYFADRKRFRNAILSDINPDLINCYTVVKDSPQALMALLDSYQKTPTWNTPEYFEHVRTLNTTDPIEQAARLIYLNKTAFNGLYRVNKYGVFNVPFGKYPNPKLYNQITLTNCSKALRKFAFLHQGDYAEILSNAKEGDLVYMDPPYIPVSTTANFTSYTAGNFGLEEQKKLARLFQELFNRGVIVIQSNSDTPQTRKLYEGFKIHNIRANRSINSKGDKRGVVDEVVIVGMPTNLKTDVPSMNYLPDVYPVKCRICETTYSTSDIICPQCGGDKIC